jgi:hypothetical protein
MDIPTDAWRHTLGILVCATSFYRQVFKSSDRISRRPIKRAQLVAAKTATHFMVPLPCFSSLTGLE